MSFTISQSLLPEFDMEMANTRKVLERVPEQRLGWRPHTKSMSMRQLASHLADLADWAAVTLSQDDFDVNPKDGPAYQPFDMSSVVDNVKHFDDGMRRTRELLQTATDETMMRTWTLKASGQTLMAMPKAAVWRSLVMNHMIHHRAQLLVYLRQNDVPIPGLYGPSADEQ
jgi:uncharacterized damage-inducible protein DinB